MALYEDVQNRLAERAKKEAAAREEAIKIFGKPLGEAFFNYSQLEPGESVDRIDLVKAYAGEIATALESGNQEKIKTAISALLVSIDMMRVPVAEQASRANINTSLY
jgi:hypothetical protein